MDLVVESEGASSNPSVEVYVDTLLVLDERTFSGVLVSVRDDVRVGLLPGDLLDLHDGDHAGEIEDLSFEVLVVFHSGEVEEFGVVADFVLETCFVLLLRLSQLLAVFEEVCVG